MQNRTIKAYIQPLGTGAKYAENTLRKVYNKCKPAMQKKFGRILTFEEFCRTLSYAHEKGMVK